MSKNMNLPKEFVERMRAQLGDGAELAAFLASFDERRQMGLRVNSLKISAADFAARFADIAPVPWCGEGFYYTGETPASRHPYYAAGLYYIQEPSAMLPVSVLDVQPGDRVLDLCASPGGKSTQIAAAQRGEGLLVANDVNFGRIPQLVKNMEMAGVKNAVITSDTPERLASRFENYFDKILVDAPCSGEGMFRKDPAAVAAWDVNKSARLAAVQKGILAQAAKMLRPGGRMVYSTCTFNRAENEEVVADFLEGHADFVPRGTARIWPHKERGEGHFCQTLEVRGQRLEASIGEMMSNADGLDLKHFFGFWDEYVLPERPRVFVHKSRVYALPEGCPDMAGLGVVRLGLFLGELKKQRFVPSYALAMTLRGRDFAHVIDCGPGDRVISRFLGGESFEINARDGYNLFCVEGFALGFARILMGRLKWRS